MAIMKYKGNGLNLTEETDDISQEQTWNENRKYIWEKKNPDFKKFILRVNFAYRQSKAIKPEQENYIASGILCKNFYNDSKFI